MTVRPTDVPPLDEEAMAAARERWATRAKPPGSLGRLEDVAVLLAGIAGRCPPPVPGAPAVLVFAADHGVVASGASAWPQEVTGLMVEGMARGGAAVNCFADALGIDVAVVDVGVVGPVPSLAGRHDAKVAEGTRDLSVEAAMSPAQAREAVGTGTGMAAATVGAGADLLVAGDMGIGNTTSAAALISAITGADVASVVGPGAGPPTLGLGHKVDLARAGLDRVTDPADGIHLLSEVGGFEIAAMAGCYVEAANQRVPFVVDGVIALAALLVADLLAPGVARRAIAGHRSPEPGASIALDHLGLTPLLDLGLRLGEGTGAVLAVPLLRAAARALGAMAELPGAPS